MYCVVIKGKAECFRLGGWGRDEVNLRFDRQEEASFLSHSKHRTFQAKEQLVLQCVCKNVGDPKGASKHRKPGTVKLLIRTDTSRYFPVSLSHTLSLILVYAAKNIVL